MASPLSTASAALTAGRLGLCPEVVSHRLWPNTACSERCSGAPVHRITRTCARISDRTLSDKYFLMIEAVEANYSSQLSYFRPAGHHNLIDMARGNSTVGARPAPTSPALVTVSVGHLYAYS